MIQRLFLNRVHAETAGSPVRGQDDLILQTFAHEAQALLPLLELAEPRTEVALDAAVIQPVPVLGGKSVTRTHCFVNEVAAVACSLSLDRWISYIVPPDGGSQVFGRGGEQPPSTTVPLRRQVTIAL